MRTVRSIRLTAVALVVLLQSAPALAAGFRCPAKGGDPWREVRSRHFLIDTDVPTDRIPHLVKKLEQLHALELQALVGEQVEIPGRLRVVAPAGLGLFRDLTGNDFVAGYAGESGFGEKVIVLPFTGAEIGETNRVAAHELAHYLSWFLFPRQPSWFSEGLAHFVESVGNIYAPAGLAPTGSHIKKEVNLRGRVAGLATRGLGDVLSQYGVVPAKELLAWQGEEKESDGGRYHASSWLLYHYLWNTRSKPFQKFQELIQSGDDPEAAWRAAFPEYDPASPAGPERLDGDLRGYRSQGRFAVWTVEAAEDATFTVAPLTSAAVHMLLHDVRMGGERTADRAEEEEAFAEDPLDAEALLRHLVREKQAVADPMRKLTVANPGDWRAWYLLGDSLSTSPKELAEREAAYRRAVALNPDFAPAQNGLAWLLAGSGRSRAALPFANRAADLAPGSPAVLDTLATVAADLGKCADGLVLERRAAAIARAAERDEYARRLRALEQRCAARSAR